MDGNRYRWTGGTVAYGSDSKLNNEFESLGGLRYRKVYKTV